MDRRGELWNLFVNLLQLAGEIQKEEIKRKMLNDDIGNIEHPMNKAFIENANTLIKGQLTMLKNALGDGKRIAQEAFPDKTLGYVIKTDEYIDDIDKILAKIEGSK